MYEPQNANHRISHNTLTAATEAVFRTMLDSVEGETRLYGDDDPLLKDYKGKTGVYETSLAEHNKDLSNCLDRYCSDQEMAPGMLSESGRTWPCRYCKALQRKEFEIGYDNSFTTKALYRLRFKWPIINEAYLDQLFMTLNAFGFFDVTEEW